MYLSFYELKDKPFQISVDPRFLWMGEKFRAALDTLRNSVLDNRGVIALIGDVGTGKTTLINALVGMLEKEFRIVCIRDPGFAPKEFFQYAAHKFCMNAGNITGMERFRQQLEAVLTDCAPDRRNVVLVIDEAQRLSRDLLNEILLLRDPDSNLGRRLNLLFVGQPEFRNLVQPGKNGDPGSTIFFTLGTLTEDDTAAYIRHRLKISALEKTTRYFTPLHRNETGEYIQLGARLPLPHARREIFTPSAMRTVYAHSRGYPRRINILCDRALLTGYAEGTRTLTSDHIAECAAELELPAGCKAMGDARHDYLVNVRNCPRLPVVREHSQPRGQSISPPSGNICTKADVPGTGKTPPGRRSAAELKPVCGISAVCNDIEKAMDSLSRLTSNHDHSAGSAAAPGSMGMQMNESAKENDEAPKNSVFIAGAGFCLVLALLLLNYLHP